MQIRSVLAWSLIAAPALAPLAAQAQTTQPGDPGEYTPARPKEAAPPQEAGSEGTEPQKQPGTQPTEQRDRPGGFGGLFGGPMGLVFIMLIALLLMTFWSSRSRRKQQAKKQDMLNSLKKGDKVISIGGIVGTVIEVRSDHITLKVDETNNVRMRFVRSAIQGPHAEPSGETLDKKT